MLKKIEEAVAKKIPALRARTRFQPMGGPGDVLYPPTYFKGGDPRHDRIIDGQTVGCVLLDSVASQANRMEEALLPYEIPRLEMTVGDYHVTSLTAPHRFTDVILRSCDGYRGRVAARGQRRQKGSFEVDLSTIGILTGVFGLRPDFVKGMSSVTTCGIREGGLFCCPVFDEFRGQNRIETPVTGFRPSLGVDGTDSIQLLTGQLCFDM